MWVSALSSWRCFRVAKESCGILQPLIRSGGEATVTTVCARVLLKPVKGTCCSGITSASHAEGPGLNPQCFHTTFDFLLCGCSLVCMLELFRKFDRRWMMTPAGLEPAIPGSVGRCLIHWATGPSIVADGSLSERTWQGPARGSPPERT